MEHSPRNNSEPGEGEEGGENEEEKVEVEKPIVVENDYLEKAKASPPQDPEGTNCLIPDLILTKERLVEIVNRALNVTMEWLISEKQSHHDKAIEEAKILQDQSVEELDENLRMQWPRKGRLEVEVYQERKS
jgi:DNA repair ATPase RecN